MQNPEVPPATQALQSTIATISARLGNVILPEKTKTSITDFWRIVQSVSEEDRTENVEEWKRLGAHLQTLLTTIIRPLGHEAEAEDTDIVEHVKTFCMRWSEITKNRLEPRSHVHFVTNDSVNGSVTTISDLNGLLDKCLKPYSEPVETLEHTSFFYKASHTNAKKSIFINVGGDLRIAYNSGVLTPLTVCVVGLLLSFILKRAFVKSQTEGQATDSISHKVVWEPGLLDGTEFSLIATPDFFYGREELVSNITHLISGGQESGNPAHIPIMGPPGMGKTSVAAAAIHDPHIIEIFGNNRHWVSCEVKNDIASLLDHLARMFSLSLESSTLLRDITSYLQENDVPRIILLDNFETLWDSDNAEIRSKSEFILASLRSIPKLTLLITMRGSVLPSGVPWTILPRLEIEPLSLDAARKTFISHNPHYIDDQLDDLLYVLDCWPLAITLTAKVGRGDQMTPSELLISWEKEKTELLKIKPGTTRLDSLDISIALSLHSGPIVSNPDALRLLRVVSRLPGGVRPQRLEHIASEIQSVNATRRTLVDASLVYKRDGAYKVLSPIRAYVIKNMDPNEFDEEAMRTFNSDILAMRKFYFQLVEESRHYPATEAFHDAFRSLFQEESNIQSVITSALENETSIDAVRATIHYSNYLYWNTPSTELLDKAIDLIRKDPSTELKSLMPEGLLNLGKLFRRMDKFSLAVSTLIEGKEQSESHGNLDMAAVCCLQLADVYIMQKKHNQTLEVLDTARNHFNATGNQRGLSDYLEGLGRAYRRQGNYEKAASALIQSRDICIKFDDRACIAMRLNLLGSIYRSEGKVDEAIKTLNEAGGYFNNTIIPPFLMVENIYNLGIAYYMRQDYNRADVTLAQAYDGFKILGNRAMMAWVLFQQGDLNHRRGHLEEASKYLEKALHNFKQIEWSQAVAFTLLSQARIFAALYRVDDARKSCSDASNIIGDQDGYEPNDEFIVEYKLSCTTLTMGSVTSYVVAFGW